MQKDIWLKELSEFIVEANRETYAAGKGKVEPLMPNHKTHRYKKNPWELVDDYSGNFRAPGITWVSYHDKPVWHMYYGGYGMAEGESSKAQETFQFLSEALMGVAADMPFRGPNRYKNGDWIYTFRLKGDIENGTWKEKITHRRKLEFIQTGGVGIYIHKTSDGRPLMLWEISTD